MERGRLFLFLSLLQGLLRLHVLELQLALGGITIEPAAEDSAFVRATVPSRTTQCAWSHLRGGTSLLFLHVALELLAQALQTKPPS